MGVLRGMRERWKTLDPCASKASFSSDACSFQNIVSAGSKVSYVRENIWGHSERVQSPGAKLSVSTRIDGFILTSTDSKPDIKETSRFIQQSLGLCSPRWPEWPQLWLCSQRTPCCRLMPPGTVVANSRPVGLWACPAEAGVDGKNKSLSRSSTEAG